MKTASASSTHTGNLCVRCKCKPIQLQKWKLCKSCYQSFHYRRYSTPNFSFEKFIEETPLRCKEAQVVDTPTNIIRLETQSKEFIAHSPKMRNLLELISRVGITKETVLLTGETGTGKGVFAREIHNISERRAQSFVTVDCTGLSEHILESELFGHRKGAFTGATEHKMGLCEFANGGTLFLDEVGELPLHMQSKLLHVLEEKEIRLVGGLEYRPVDIRVIAATNQNLDELVKQKRFRADLFYRLSVLELPIPPLRERLEEIPLLIGHFGQKLEKMPEFSPDVLELFSRYKWPGNVRELRNIVHRCAVFATDVVNIKQLPEHFVSVI